MALDLSLDLCIKYQCLYTHRSSVGSDEYVVVVVRAGRRPGGAARAHARHCDATTGSIGPVGSIDSVYPVAPTAPVGLAHNAA